jgi:hypothetical protein
MTSRAHRVAHQAGAALSALGAVLLVMALSLPAASAARSPAFKGDCLGTVEAGTCILDEPEGRDPAVHGVVTYAMSGGLLTFTVVADAPVTDVQICMQTTGPFDEDANACAGSHGNHVTYGQDADRYVVDLAANGFPDPASVYWTLHVVVGGRTLQVRGPGRLIPPTTTTSVPGTTSTGPTTSTSVGPTSTTSTPSTTILPTTSVAPGVTTTVAPSSSSTAAVTPSTAARPDTEVLGEQLARTGPRVWGLVAGAVLLAAGLTLVLAVRLLTPNR